MTKPRSADVERRLLSYDLAAAYLSISPRGMKQLAKEGEIRKVSIGHRVLFDRADLDEFVERMKKVAS